MVIKKHGAKLNKCSLQRMNVTNANGDGTMHVTISKKCR